MNVQICAQYGCYAAMPMISRHTSSKWDEGKWPDSSCPRWVSYQIPVATWEACLIATSVLNHHGSITSILAHLGEVAAKEVTNAYRRLMLGKTVGKSGPQRCPTTIKQMHVQGNSMCVMAPAYHLLLNYVYIPKTESKLIKNVTTME